MCQSQGFCKPNIVKSINSVAKGVVELFGAVPQVVAAKEELATCGGSLVDGVEWQRRLRQCKVMVVVSQVRGCNDGT